MTPSRSWFSRWLIAATLVVASSLVGLQPASAQYFGRNKVQYRTFDFRVLKTPHFDVYYYPEEEAAARDAARMAERWYTRLSRLLDHEFEERQPLILYANHAHFQQTTTISGSIGEGTGGVTEAFKQRVVMPLTGTYAETDHVLGHELVHAFQYDISGLGRAGGGLAQAAQRFNVPLWFVEGMAEYLSVGPVDSHTAMWLRDAALTGDIPSIEMLSTDPRIFPYRYGHALWAYIAGRWGDAVVGQILKLVGQGVPYPEAFQRLTNSTLDEISADWHVAIRRAYLPLLAERPEAREIAKPLITQDKRGGRLNLAPALSPDGKWVAFLSELDFFDIELWLANAETGEIVRKLVKGTSFDPHFGSLRFIASAGTFSPDGKLFAFSALRSGRDVLVILDVARAKILREIPMPTVPEITNPTWSPDGRTIVFSGTKGGISNLYLFNLETGTTDQLTDDWHADLMPSYSKDGRTIAFVTDRGPVADLSELRWDGYNIALMDVETRDVRVVDMEGENVNPMWAGDGRSLYFKSNRTGVPNIYRLDTVTGEVFRVTELFAGVSGITDLSPAIASARDGRRLVFTAFEDGGYNMYAITNPKELEGTPVPPRPEAGAQLPVPQPAILPPVPRPTEPAFTRVSALLEDWSTGLPSAEVAAAWPVVPYQPSLGLDYLGQPQVGVSAGTGYGTSGVYGGISGIWSDVLGRHTVFAALQASGQIDEIGGTVMYLNRRSRWNYGAIAQRIPYVIPIRPTAQLDTLETNQGDVRVIRERFPRFRLFDTKLQALAQYPFSQVQRVEFAAGFRRIASDLQGFERTFAAVEQNGRLFRGGVIEEGGFEDELDGMNLVETSGALVYDAALLSYTSPFAGRRYRFELAPTFGELQMVTATADYREYLWFRPFTFAFRGYHYGRYGRDSEGVFRDLFLGYPSLVRGYGVGYLSSACEDAQATATVENPCAEIEEVYDQTQGSRLGVLKAELRFPLIRALVLGIGRIGLPPIEGFGFFDAGVAWGEGQDPVFRLGLQRGTDNEFLSTERGILASYGVGARVNLFGYAILEVNYVNPLVDELGWHFQFALQPGF